MIALNNCVWHCVFYYDGVAAYEGFRPDAAELMYAGICPYVCTVADFDMAGKRRCVCHNNVVSNAAIVSNVCLCHQEIVVADYSLSAAAGRSAVNGYKFTYLISAANYRFGFFAGVFKVLRCKPNRYKRENVRFVADGCPAVNNRMRIDAYTSPKRNLVTDDAKRSNSAIIADLRLCGYNCCAVNDWWHIRPSGQAIFRVRR
jgi:hypothetical protein